MNTFVTSSTLKKDTPSTANWLNIKNKILGQKYTLSLVFIGTQRALTLNRTCRQKEYIPNILSFPLDDKTGEIFICPAVAYREASKFNLSKRGYLTYLFIHGCLHLKGYEHSDKMDQLEKKYLKTFNVT